MSRTTPVRLLLKALSDAGAVPVRRRGSHETWRFSNGETVTLQVNHLGAPAAPHVLGHVRRALKAQGGAP